MWALLTASAASATLKSSTDVSAAPARSGMSRYRFCAKFVSNSVCTEEDICDGVVGRDKTREATSRRASAARKNSYTTGRFPFIFSCVVTTMTYVSEELFQLHMLAKL